ncbi:hypothetical protein ACHAQH_003370 [Verticillium albo-atrum]
MSGHDPDQGNPQVQGQARGQDNSQSHAAAPATAPTAPAAAAAAVVSGAHHQIPGTIPVPIGLPPEFDPNAMKLTRGTSCVLCQQRKVRCDKKKPCANCVKARVECRVVAPNPPRRRKKHLQEKDLIDRLKKYETLLAENGVSIDPIARDLRVSNHGGIDEVADLENDLEGLHTSPDGSQASSSRAGFGAGTHRPDKVPYKWFLFHREFRASEDLMRDSSDEEELDGSAVHRAFDKMYENQDGFPFIVGANRETSVYHYHPTPVQIFQLWQIYINNVNPLLKITHIPTVQGLVIEATSNLDDVPKNVEALLFSIYIMAVLTIDDGESRRLFGEPKAELLSRFHKAGQQALVNAGFMRTTDMMVLQAYILFLIAIRMFVDPRQIFCYVGIAVRIGQRMGLHRDAQVFGLSPFEVEQRRRLWWTIVGYDRRIGEMTGSTVTALSTIGDCKLPLNINDTDLHADGKEAPTEHAGPTEMLFSLIRAELAMAISTDASKDPRVPIDKNNPIASRPLSMVRMAGPGGQWYTLDGFFAHIEGTYLRFCDQKIPLHFFTLTMTRQALCKMRVVSFLVRLANNDPAAALNEHERDTLFLEATQMIEYDNIVQSAESLRGYKWYTFLHFPFPAYMFLVTEMRQRTTGPLVDRAWDAITENHELRGLMNTLHNPMHIAFGNLFVKAWDARAAAQRQQGIVHQAPSWIGRLRERAEKASRDGKRPRKDPLPSAPPSDGSPAVIPNLHQAGPMGPTPRQSVDYPQPQQQQQQEQQQQQPLQQQQQQQQQQSLPRFGAPGEMGMMATPPGENSGLDPAQLMGLPDMNNEFGDMNWGFFMQGYDMNNFAGFPPGFGPFPAGPPDNVEVQGAPPVSMPPAPAQGNPYR